MDNKKLQEAVSVCLNEIRIKPFYIECTDKHIILNFTYGEDKFSSMFEEEVTSGKYGDELTQDALDKAAYYLFYYLSEMIDTYLYNSGETLTNFYYNFSYFNSSNFGTVKYYSDTAIIWKCQKKLLSL